mgnify:CR=1 FL=1
MKNMKTVKYKTNINCGSCLKSVTPFLNELANVDTWKVDNGSEEQIIKAVKHAGFKIESTIK